MGFPHYVVWVGKQPGIYSSWPECKDQVNGFPNALYKGFLSYDKAKKAFDAYQCPSTSKDQQRSKDVALDKGSTSSKNDHVKATLERKDLKVTIEGKSEDVCFMMNNMKII